MYERIAVAKGKQGVSVHLDPDEEAHEAKVVRYGRAHLRADAMADFLTRLAGESPVPRPDLRDRAGRLANCGAFLTFRDYFTRGEVRLTSATFCQQDKLCPLCAIRRGGRYLRAYSERIAALLRADPSLRFWLLTLTVRDGPDLLERFDHLDASVRRLMQRRRNAGKPRQLPSALAPVLGGVGSTEVKRGRGSGLWHPHRHYIVAAPAGVVLGEQRGSKWPWPALSEEWREITGDSHVVDCRPLHNAEEPGEDLTEVFKYALKFAELELSDNLDAFHLLLGRHLIHPFGIFRGVQVPADLTDEPLGPDLPFMELLYRYGGAGKYRLLRTVCQSPAGVDRSQPTT
jgi:hypothetical protein